MPAKLLKEFLDQEKVKYVSIRHSEAFTSQEIAASAHIPGKELAKTVMIKIDGEMAMAVLPASEQVDTELLKEFARTSNVEVATEEQFRSLFPGCEVGAMPPFGNLYGMKVFVASTLTEDDEIAFNAGSHTELIKMGYMDYERLVQPKIARFTMKG